MKKCKWYPILLTGLVLLLAGSLVACVPEPVPTATPEPAIPADFTTYTCEGLFSISYPSDWVPAQSLIEELLEAAKAEMEAEAPMVSSEGLSVLFLAGKETAEGWYPTVSIGTDRRPIGYWTLDQAHEANTRYAQEYTPGFKELSVQKTTVDGRDAIVIVSEDNEPGYGKWQYVQMLTVKGDYVWLVGCSCEAQDFYSYEDTFISVVRSFRILK